MTKEEMEEMIEENGKRGYIFCGEDNQGSYLWKKFDGTATVYYLDEGYPDVGPLPVWNTLRDKSVLELILKDLQP